MHHLIEERFRKPKANGASGPRFLLGSGALAIALALPAAHAWTTGGWGWRWDVPQGILEVAGNFGDVRQRTWKFVQDDQLVNPPTFSTSSKDVTKILLIGDSHSKDVFNAFYTNSEFTEKLELRQSLLATECIWRLAENSPPLDISISEQRNCEKQAAELLRSKTLGQADWIMLSLRWRSDSAMLLADVFKNLRKHSDKDGGSRLAVFGNTPEFTNVPTIALNHGEIEGLAELAARKRKSSTEKISERILLASKANNVLFIDKLDWVCNESRTSCTMTDEEDRLLIYDYGHWTLDGAKYYGKRMLDSGIVNVLTGLPTGQ